MNKNSKPGDVWHDQEGWVTPHRKAVLGSTPLFDALERLQGLAERWNETEVWHDPPFLDGTIKINTGDLRDIATVCRELSSSNSQDHSQEQ